jgi:hypothetical protein
MKHAPLAAAFVALALVACGTGDNGNGATGNPDGSAPPAEGGADGGLGVGDASPGDSGTGLHDASNAPDAGPVNAPQPLSANIVVDQFGYRTADEKIAVVRSPTSGFDTGSPFTPGARYALVDGHSGAKLVEAAPKAWNGGASDPSSGDKAWWFDFSSVTTPGDYFVLDETANVRSPVFRISDDAYRSVLVAATRMLYYQRDGIAKDAAHAGADWVDGLAHPQDAQCGLYSDGSGPRDLHGGWFDAGDQNRYTNWAASDAIELLRAYVESPAAFADDTNIPESGNGVADLLDEVKWELDWMTRMQGADGSMLSIAGHAGASPPSSDTSPCKYGPANTSASLTSAAAFAYASIVYAKAPGVSTAYPGFAADMASRAQKAWTWAIANPAVTFSNSGKVGAGEQEVDDAGRAQKKVQAAVFLFELTQDVTYKSAVDAGYKQLLASFDPFHVEPLDTALEYTKATGATAAVVTDILSTYKADIKGTIASLAASPDPYFAYLHDYTWGSNQVKASQGSLLTDVSVFGIDAASNVDATRDAERYVHYLHGVNPLQLVFLSNMEGSGSTKSVTRFFHTWFAHGSSWDAAGVSKYGPPPGYLTGGPNPSYAWDGCCPAGCGSTANNQACGSASPSPPAGQPAQKAYKDFNDNWPLDSWQVTEPDDGYQAHYIRLLSKFAQ